MALASTPYFLDRAQVTPGLSTSGYRCILNPGLKDVRMLGFFLVGAIQPVGLDIKALCVH